MGKDVAPDGFLWVDLEGHSSAGISGHLIRYVDNNVVLLAKILIDKLKITRWKPDFLHLAEHLSKLLLSLRELSSSRIVNAEQTDD